MTFDFKARTPEENAAVDRRAGTSRYRRVKAQRDRLQSECDAANAQILRLRDRVRDLTEENARAWALVRSLRGDQG